MLNERHPSNQPVRVKGRGLLNQYSSPWCYYNYFWMTLLYSNLVSGVYQHFVQKNHWEHIPQYETIENSDCVTSHLFEQEHRHVFWSSHTLLSYRQIQSCWKSCCGGQEKGKIMVYDIKYIDFKFHWLILYKIIKWVSKSKITINFFF